MSNFQALRSSSMFASHIYRSQCIFSIIWRNFSTAASDIVSAVCWIRLLKGSCLCSCICICVVSTCNILSPSCAIAIRWDGDGGERETRDIELATNYAVEYWTVSRLSLFSTFFSYSWTSALPIQKKKHKQQEEEEPGESSCVTCGRAKRLEVGHW